MLLPFAEMPAVWYPAAGHPFLSLMRDRLPFGGLYIMDQNTYLRATLVSSWSNYGNFQVPSAPELYLEGWVCVSGLCWVVGHSSRCRPLCSSCPQSSKPVVFQHNAALRWFGADVGGGGESVKLGGKRRQKLERYLLLQGETGKEQELEKCHQAFKNKLNQEFLSGKPVGRSVLLAAWSHAEPEVNGC